MYIGSRNGAPIEKIVVHVNVGPDTHAGAPGLVNFLNSIQGGYHVVVDDVQYVQAAPDSALVYGASGMNGTGLHVCILGYAQQTRAEWLDTFSMSAMKIAAGVCSQWSKKYGIPCNARLTPQQVATYHIKGICGHVDVERSGLPGTGGVSGHWDPGTWFPWDVFLPMIGSTIINPAPTPHTPKEEDMQVFIDWDHPGPSADRPRTAAITPGGVILLTNGAKISGLPMKPWPGTKGMLYADAHYPPGEDYQGADRLRDKNGFIMMSLMSNGQSGTRKVLFAA